MLKNIFLGLICIIVLAIAPSCKKSCGLNCQHNGSCDGNVCSCPDPYSGRNCDTQCAPGYEGYMCQTPSKEKFYGTWSCTSTDQYGNSKSYLITFTNNTMAGEWMNMNNFNNVSTYPINCTLSGKNKFDINQYQQDSLATLHNAQGSGAQNNGKLTLYVYIDSYQYFATATKQ